MTNRISAPVDFQLAHDAFGRLVLTMPDGAQHVGVHPVRGFPISDPQRGIALCTAEGHELVWIEDLIQLAPALRTVLEKELAHREFLPIIKRIVRVSLQTNPCQWEVETDRGPTKFVLKSEDDVRRLENHRALVTDAHGIRYLIPDPESLDRHSRRVLERYL
ncbi:MAG TPA: DUF1854 domain-containing protein [Pirellulales bacterium]|jgi:hypothetical protein